MSIEKVKMPESESASRKTWVTYFLILFAIFICQIGMGMKNGLNPLVLGTFSLPIETGVFLTVAYAIIGVGLAPVLGRFSDFLGRKWVAAAGIALSAIGFILSAMATDFIMVVVGWALLGLTIAALIPAGPAYAQTHMPAKDRGKAMGWYPLASTPGGALGPLFGGMVADAWGGWRSAYWVSAALMALCLIWIIFLMPQTEERFRSKDRRIDWAGVVCILFTVSCMFVLFNRAQVWGFTNPLTWALIVGFLGGGFVTVMVEKGKPNAILDVRYMGTRDFLVPILVMFTIFTLLGSSGYISAFFIAGALGGTATMMGMASLFLILPLSVISPFAGQLSDRVGPKPTALVGIVISIVGLIGFAMVNGATTFEYILACCALQGAGCGLFFVPFMHIALHRVPPERAQSAAGTFAMIKDTDAPLATSIYGTMFGLGTTAMTGTFIFTRLGELGVPQPVMDLIKTSGFSNPAVTQALSDLGIKMQEVQAYAVTNGMAAAMSSTYWIQVVLGVVGLIVAVIFLPNIAPKKVVKPAAEAPAEG